MPENCPTCGRRYDDLGSTDYTAGKTATSVWTYGRIAKSKGRFYPQIAKALARAGHPLTDEELLCRTDCQANGIRARRGEMQQAGLVIRTGGTAPTRSGQKADTWRLTSLGLSYFYSLP